MSSAARAIGLIGGPSALPALEKAMESGRIGDDMSYKAEVRRAIEKLREGSKK